MANDINRVVLVGRLTREPELKVTSTGTHVCKISLANNQTQFIKDGDNIEHVGFYDCVAFGKLAEMISKYAQKGRRVGIDGMLSYSAWEDTEGKKRSKVEIRIETFQFLDVKSESTTTETPSTEPQSASQTFSDDIPF